MKSTPKEKMRGKKICKFESNIISITPYSDEHLIIILKNKSIKKVKLIAEENKKNSDSNERKSSVSDYYSISTDDSFLKCLRKNLTYHFKRNPDYFAMAGFSDNTFRLFSNNLEHIFPPFHKKPITCLG